MGNNQSVIYLTIYLLLWIITLFFKQKKFRFWGASCIFYLSLAFYAALGILYYYNSDFNERITLFPLLYLYVMFRIAALPIEQYDNHKIQGVLSPRNERLVTAFTVAYFIIAATQIPSIISNISDGITKILLDSMGGAELYSETKANTVSYDGSINNVLSAVYGVFSPLLFLLLFYYLSKETVNKKIVFGLLFCVLVEFLSGIANGQRTGATMLFMSLIITYFAFHRFLSRKLLKYIKISGVVLGIAILIPFAFLTFSRFGETERGVGGGVADYMGQSVVNFDLYAFSANGTRNGDRTCNSFKHLLGIPGTPKGMEETRNKYSYMKLDDSSFSTFVGDFVLDFGPFTTFLIFSIISLFLLNATRFNGRLIPFHKLILCYLLMIICMQGGMYLFTFSYKGNLSLIAIFLFYLVFRIDYNKRLVGDGKR